jgi:hypothetical protein
VKKRTDGGHIARILGAISALATKTGGRKASRKVATAGPKAR